MVSLTDFKKKKNKSHIMVMNQLSRKLLRGKKIKRVFLGTLTWNLATEGYIYTNSSK